ncbi:EAL domain-containing protein [Cellulomonas sp. DKR-3]|uniref:EAL domain-containing protein n=1 Tax=Cellulomonas fulva TaxID=2835530 RepID=A0ABS5TZZ4_9CELL|nr:EAL domain-containing protein [Cellulomonas fulva]MBT0994729.1 EAL domain-containing protein [Cellulomonas fulva]
MTAHASPSPALQPRVARQPIWDLAGALHGYELLYRTPDGVPAGVDRWQEPYQEEASAAVLDQLDRVAGPELSFVNITRGFLVQGRTLPPHAGRLVLEVVETVPADDAALAGLQRLRAQGYRIALDDFTASAAQLAMLPWADYVKIDCRDLLRHGTALVELARSHGALVVAERVSDARLVARCTRWGFDLLQGDALGAATTSAS